MNNELNEDQLKEWAKYLYIREDKNLQQISDITGADQSSLRKWSHDGFWDGVKRTLPTARNYQLEQLYSLLDKTTTKMNQADEVNPKDVDLVMKYTTAIKNLDMEVGIPQIVEVAKLFTTWLRTKNEQMAKNFTIELDNFIRQRVKPGTT